MTSTQTSIRASYGALIDMITACRIDVPDTDGEEAIAAYASRRMVSMLFGGGYLVGRYKEAFADITAMSNAKTITPAEVLSALVDKYGNDPHTRFTA